MRWCVLGNALDVGAEPSQLFFQPLIAAVQMMNAADKRFPFGRQAGQNQGGTRTQVAGGDVGGDEIRGPVDRGAIAGMINLGAKAPQLFDMSKALREDA